MDIFISLPAQTLELFDRGILLRRYSVSSAKAGAGENTGSYCTPRGRHLIRAKIGAGRPENTVFVGRRPTGEVWSPEFSTAHPRRDWILTRILWLSGREPGFNRLGAVDTMRRYIYLHGSPDTVAMGQPGSIGCVRMRNTDIVDLFDRVAIYTPVNIAEFRIEEGDWQSVMARASALCEQMQEQGAPLELERDRRDSAARYALALDPTGNTIAHGRLLTNRDTSQIGPITVVAKWRAKGVGSALVKCLLERARLDGSRQIVLSAQSHSVSFYAQFGFIPEGQDVTKAGVPQIRMRRVLPA
jgi:predicted GNAT family N-acyltransferase